MPPHQTSLSHFFHKSAEKITAFKALAEEPLQACQRSPPTPGRQADGLAATLGEGGGESGRHTIGVWDRYARTLFGAQPDGPQQPTAGQTFWAVYVAERRGCPDEYACCAGRVLSDPSQRWGELFEFQYDGPDGGPPIWVPRHWLFRCQQQAEEVIAALNAKLDSQRLEAAEQRRKAKPTKPSVHRGRRPHSEAIQPPGSPSGKRPRPRATRHPSPPGCPHNEDVAHPEAPSTQPLSTAASAEVDDALPTTPTGDHTTRSEGDSGDSSLSLRASMVGTQSEVIVMPELKEDGPASPYVKKSTNLPCEDAQPTAPTTVPAEPPLLEASPGKGAVLRGAVGLKLWFLSSVAGGPVLVGQPRLPDMTVADFFTAGVLGQMEEFEAMRPPPGKVLYAFRVDRDGGKRPLTSRAAATVALSDSAGFILSANPIAGALWAEVAPDGRLVRHAGLLPPSS
eukprot:GGOE01014430.1.p1 GENE.GGOE01014430.1~~GGOE01014430.1.p1  ORF type:complete len:471 (+),score=91.10 GGOE01014430.1:55-1413(+)